MDKSAQFRNWLYENIGKDLFTEDIVKTAESIFRPSFTEAVINNSEAESKCPTCKKTHRVYRFNWRKEYVPVMKLARGRAMTTAEIGKHFLGQTARKVPSELVHWNLMRIAGTRAGQRLYRVTKLGEDFLDGKVRVPESVWPETAPKECEAGTERYVHELVPDFDHESREAHIHHSIAL